MVHDCRSRLILAAARHDGIVMSENETSGVGDEGLEPTTSAV
jgi:hypothetical protein